MFMGSLNGFHSDLNIESFTVICQQDSKKHFHLINPMFRWKLLVLVSMNVFQLLVLLGNIARPLVSLGLQLTCWRCWRKRINCTKNIFQILHPLPMVLIHLVEINILITLDCQKKRYFCEKCKRRANKTTWKVIN